jgi:Phosphotransferase enzyme family
MLGIRISRPAAGGPESVGLTAQEPLSYLHEVCELLWPPPAVVTMHDGRSQPQAPGVPRFRASSPDHPGVSNLARVPGLGRPPLVVPAEQRVAAAALRHFSGQRARAPRLTIKLLSFLLAFGFGGVALRGQIRVEAVAGADTIETYLADLLGQDFLVSMYVGPPRANRKPVLHLLSPDGDPVAFVKVGVNPLTRELVRAERATLARLEQAGLTGIGVPRVLWHEQWRGLEVLVLSPVPAWRRRRALRPAQLTAAMNTVAGIDGLCRAPLTGHPYLRRLRERLACADQREEQAALLRALDVLAAQSGGTTLTFGSWHGDWSPWNMACTDRGLLVWDWERFTSGVPLGFDALHYRLQADVGPGHRDPLAAATASLQDAPRLLAPFGISAEQARITGILYLADLATRYLADRQLSAGARNGDPGTWLIPAITREVAGI